MKKKLLKSLKRALPIFVVGLCLVSCDNLLEVEPDNALESEQFYQNRFDADAAVLGIYGKFLGLAEHHLVLNELRADLMAVTPAAPESMVQLSQHTVTEGNEYANPRPFYEIIVLCNDAITNFERMKMESKLLPAEFDQRYSDLVALRSWLYMQLVIHYGKARYVTDPLAKITDVSDLNRFPLYDIDQMLDSLIVVMEKLPYKEQYPQLGTDIISASIDGQSTRKMFINKRVLMGDLYLWDGQYRKAAIQYKQVMETPISVTGGNEYNSYKIREEDVTDHNDFAVGFVRDQREDTRSLVGLLPNDFRGWKAMFALETSSRLFNDEWIWVLPLDYRFNQKTPFVKLFSPIGGDYLLKPSQHAIDMWEDQVQSTGSPWDQRGRWSWNMQNGQPVIMKHIYNFSPVNPLQTQGKWFLYRAALLHLRFAEAANRDEQVTSRFGNQRKLAWALLNNGQQAYTVNPRNTELPSPYNFGFLTATGIRDDYHRTAGIRRRANLPNLTFPDRLKSVQDTVIYVEDKIIEEAALELAFEGHRWGDLVRIARRRNDPAFLAEKVYEKLRKANNPNAEATRDKLMNPQNWYLPYKWE